VDRIVRAILLVSEHASAGKFFSEKSPILNDWGKDFLPKYILFGVPLAARLGIKLEIPFLSEILFCRVDFIAVAEIESKPFPDCSIFFSAKWTLFQRLGWKSLPLRFERITLGLLLEISNVTGLGFLKSTTKENYISCERQRYATDVRSTAVGMTALFALFFQFLLNFLRGTTAIQHSIDNNILPGDLIIYGVWKPLS